MENGFWGFLKKIFFLMVFANVALVFWPQIKIVLDERSNPSCKVAWLPVNAIYDGFSYINKIRTFQNDPSISAFVVNMNSPGGCAGSSELLYRELLDVSKKMPVYVLVENMCCSGGYWVSMAATKIVAPETAIVGSIGVMGMFPNFKRLLDSWNIDVELMSKGEYKTAGNQFGDKLTDRQRKHYNALQDSIYDSFVNTVAQSRGLKKVDSKTWAEGKLFSGKQALELGLIDEIGDLGTIEASIRKDLCLPENQKIRFAKVKSPSAIAKLFGSEDDFDKQPPASRPSSALASIFADSKDFILRFFTGIYLF